MKEFAATVKLHNNLLRERRKMLGLKPRELAEAMGLNYQNYLALENMHEAPTNAKGDWRPTARTIAEYYGVPPEELWPKSVQAVRKTTAEIKMSADQALMLSGNIEKSMTLLSEDASPEEWIDRLEAVQGVRASLEVLSPKEQKVLRARFGFDGGEPQDLNEIGASIGVSRERARQIISGALGKLRDRKRGGAKLMALAGVTEQEVEKRKRKWVEQFGSADPADAEIVVEELAPDEVTSLEELAREDGEAYAEGQAFS